MADVHALFYIQWLRKKKLSGFGNEMTYTPHPLHMHFVNEHFFLKKNK